MLLMTVCVPVLLLLGAGTLNPKWKWVELGNNSECVVLLLRHLFDKWLFLLHFGRCYCC